MQDNLEQHPDVMNFLNNEDPNVNTIVKAYIARDIIMNIDFDKINILEKLGYTLEKVQTNLGNKVKAHLHSLVNKFISQRMTQSTYNFIEETNSVMTSEETQNYIKTRKERYDTLINIDDRVSFYESLTKDELIDLGW
jgi:hypothetical protein